MVDFESLWEEGRHCLPAWSGRVLRPKYHLCALRHADKDEKFIRREFAKLVSTLLHSVRCHGEVPPLTEEELRGCLLDEVPAEVAMAYQEEFHYLASPRQDGIHLGLGARGTC